jgi:hypothetical protein
MIRAYLPTGLVFLLAVALALSWFGAQALVFALPFGFLAALPIAQHHARDRRGMGNAAKGARAMRAALDEELERTRKTRQRFACILLRITPARVAPLTLTRLRPSLRSEDRMFDLSDGQIALLLAPVPGLDESALPTLGRRLQAIVEDQKVVDDPALHPTASLALCLGPAGAVRSGAALLDGLMVTLEEAARRGPSALLVHDPGPSPRR